MFERVLTTIGSASETLSRDEKYKDDPIYKKLNELFHKIDFNELVQEWAATYLEDGPKDSELVKAWKNFDLQTPMANALGIPTKVANDADIQGAAVIKGEGLEFVMTLGTGVGTALFQNGVLLPHLELGHAPFRQSEEFEEQIGNAARERIGVERWTKRVLKAIAKYDQFLYYDHCYVGGGNAKHIKGLDLGPKVTRVSNKAGLFGGARIWDLEAS